MLPTDDPYPYANRYRGDTATTSTLGFYYQGDRFYAGIWQSGAIPLEAGAAFPSSINAFVARDFRLGQLTLSPSLQYHYNNKATALDSRVASIQEELHQFKSGLLAQFKERYFLGLKAGMEITDVDFRSNAELRAGTYLWDQLML